MLAVVVRELKMIMIMDQDVEMEEMTPVRMQVINNNNHHLGHHWLNLNHHMD
jgi:hypothetical protein